MGYPTPSMNSNGQGIWKDDTTPSTPFTGDGNPSGMQNLLGGQDPKKVGMFSGGSASAGSSSGLSPMQGTGTDNHPGPEQSLLSTIGAGTLSPKQDTDGQAGPTNQSLLTTVGKSGSKSFTVRQPSLGGVEKDVQIP